MIKSISKTIKNSKTFIKPNEDYYINDNYNNIYVLTDGVSRDKENGLYPVNSPSQKVSVIFSNYVHNFLLKNIQKYDDKENLLYETMVKGNEEISKFNINYLGDFLPGTVGIIAIIYNNIFYYSYIGDCFGLAIANTKKHLFTKCQTELVHKHIKEFSAFEIRNIICNNINHPYSYGVFNGDIRAKDFIITGKLSLDNIKTILLYSDGFENFIKTKTIKELISLNVEELNFNTNYFCDDDKTIIKIAIKE